MGHFSSFYHCEIHTCTQDRRMGLVKNKAVSTMASIYHCHILTCGCKHRISAGSMFVFTREAKCTLFHKQHNTDGWLMVV